MYVNAYTLAKERHHCRCTDRTLIRISRVCVCVYVYVYIYINMYMCMRINIYIYI